MSDKMPEAEVSLLLAMSIASRNAVDGAISVAIDGAQIKTKETVHFNFAEFMQTRGWESGDGGGKWQGKYRSGSSASTIEVHSKAGVGDVVATLRDGSTLIVEAKKGTITDSKSSAEYPLLREALGQLLTIPKVPKGAILAVAVPHSRKFQELAERWRKAPLIKRLGILIITVSRDGGTSGLWR